MKQQSEVYLEEFAFGEVSGGELDHVEFPASQRIFLLLGVITFSLGLLASWRIGFLAVVKGGAYSERANANAYQEVISPARRGVILDRHGEVLAENKSTFSVFFNVPELLKAHDGLSLALARLAEVLLIDEEMVREQTLTLNLEEESSIAVVRDLTPQEVIAVKGLNVPGIEVHDDYVRTYPNAPAFSHVVGYTGIAERGNAVVGKNGLEAAYDGRLRGRDGKYIYYRDALGQVLEKKSSVEPSIGETLTTTIDAEFQKYFYSRLKAGVEQLGRRAGVGIAMDPRNGGVLALVNVPSFDSNVFIDRRRHEERLELLSDPQSALFNRAVAGVYNPGSAIKPLVAIAALEEHHITPETQVYSTGAIEVPNPYVPEEPTRFVDWRPHGLVDLHAALARSSNVYFYGLGGGLSAEQSQVRSIQGLGIAKLKQHWRKFGFGERTNIDLPSESLGLLPDPRLKEARIGGPWRIGDTYNVSIGQGDLLITPIQLVNFFAFLANRGRVYQPTIVKRAGPPEAVRDYPDLIAHIGEVHQGLVDAVEKPYGTAHTLSNLPVEVAGKTGSAQTSNNTKTNAFFAGYFPARDPEVVILVLVEDAREGSLNALPIAGDVVRWYYNHRLINGRASSE